MFSHVDYYLAIFGVLHVLMHNLIVPVKGQCTVPGCESGESSIGITTEIRQLFAEFHERLEAIDRRAQDQDIYIKQIPSTHELLNASVQELKTQQDTIMTSLQVIGRRSQDQEIFIKQIPSTHKLLNASVQQLKTQQDTIMTSLEVVDRRSQEQDIYIKQIPSTHELLNASVQELKTKQDTVLASLEVVDRRSQEQDSCEKQVQSIHQLLNASVQQTSSFNESLKRLQNQQDAVMRSLQSVTVGQPAQRQDVCIKEVHELLNASNQQMTNQHTSVMRRLDEFMELLLDHDISTKNQSQNLCTPATGVALQPKTVTDLGNDSTLLQHSTLLPSSNNWTIIMSRFNGSLDFDRTWIEYKNGFGDIGRGEFWLGNEEVHRLTTRSGFVYSLRVEVQLNTTGGWYYADYSTFSLDSENNKYTIRLSGFSGNAYDSLTNSTLSSAGHLDGKKFTTRDNDNDKNNGNCASSYKGGWWFDNCQYACLTCQFNKYFGFHWYNLRYLSPDGEGRLRAARMMIKSK